MTTVADPVLGCYGIGLDGLPGAARSMAQVPIDAPRYAVCQRIEPGERPAELLTDDAAVLHLSDRTGAACVDRSAATITLAVRQHYSDEAVLHPLLAGSAAAINHWLGRDSFHAGAFVLAGQAWALLGDKGHGKSSTLGYLASQGVPVIADDLVVEDDGDVLAGPAFIDLRPDAAEHLPGGRELGMLGNRMRARLDVPAVDPGTPLAGWITLAWGDAIGLRRTPVDERLRLLFENRSVRRPPRHAASYLRHAALPFYELERPKSWDVMPALLDVLIGTLGG